MKCKTVLQKELYQKVKTCLKPYELKKFSQNDIVFLLSDFYLDVDEILLIYELFPDNTSKYTEKELENIYYELRYKKIVKKIYENKTFSKDIGSLTNKELKKIINVFLKGYLKPFKKCMFNKQQLKLILDAFVKGIKLTNYVTPKYDVNKMREILNGIFKKIDVSLYQNQKYNEIQMIQIRLGLEKGLDVSKYANPKINWYEMRKTRIKLLKEKKCKTILQRNKYNS